MNKQTVYVPISKDTLPDKADRYGVLIDGTLDSVYFNGNRFELAAHIEPYLTHYLSPRQVVILDDGEVEKYEKIEQEIAVLKEYCSLLNLVIYESPCDPDITKGQIAAWNNLKAFKRLHNI